MKKTIITMTAALLCTFAQASNAAVYSQAAATKAGNGDSSQGGAAAPGTDFITRADEWMQAYHKAEFGTELPDKELGILQTCRRHALEAAAAYYREQETLGRMLTAQAAPEVWERYSKGIRRLMELDLAMARSREDWQVAPSRLKAMPAKLKADVEPKDFTTIAISEAAQRSREMREEYLQTCYNSLLNTLRGNNAYCAQLTRTYEAWKAYCVALTEAAVPGVVCNSLGGSDSSSEAAGIEEKLCFSLYEYFELLRSSGERNNQTAGGGTLQQLIDGLQAATMKDDSSRLYQKRLLTLLPMIRDGQDVNLTLPETKGNTALHYACGLGDYELVNTLLDMGADTSIRTAKGATALHCIGNDPGGRIKALLEGRSAVKKTADWEAPASIKGKTFSFSAPTWVKWVDGVASEQEEVPFSSEPPSYTVQWKWGNKHAEARTNDLDGQPAKKTRTYTKTGKRTAVLEERYESSSWNAERYELTFETPTSGTCRMEQTGTYSMLLADKYTATGTFTLK